MGITVNITKVDKGSNCVSYTQDGVSKTGEVVAPAKIEWAREGDAEVGFNNEGKLNFVKSLAPKQSGGFGGGYNNKPKPTKRAISTMETLNGVTLDEVKAVYNELNARDDAKCQASTLFQVADGKYDVAFYVTTFVPLEQVSGPEM